MTIHSLTFCEKYMFYKLYWTLVCGILKFDWLLGMKVVYASTDLSLSSSKIALDIRDRQVNVWFPKVALKQAGF